jgi:hypothetical protein
VGWNIACGEGGGLPPNAPVMWARK